MSVSEALPPLAPRLVAFARRYQGAALLSLRGARAAVRDGQGLVTGYPNPDRALEATGIPRFLGSLVRACRAL
jgi:hypothetical protein